MMLSKTAKRFDNWKYFLASDALSRTIIVFAHIFLGIYFLRVTDWNVPMIAGFYIAEFMSYLLFFYIANKLIKIDLLKMFRIGIFLYFLKLAILLVMGYGIKDYIIPYAVFFGMTNVFYYMPQQLFIKRVNSGASVNNYLTLSKIINDGASVALPVIFGAMISEGSYTIVFIFLSVCALTGFGLSFRLKNIPTKYKNINLGKFLKKIKDNGATGIFLLLTLRTVFRCLSSFSAISTIIIILTFYAFGSELSVGALNSLVAIAALVLVYFVNKKLSRQKRSKIFVPIAIVQSIVIIILTLAMIYLKIDTVLVFNLTLGMALIFLYNIINGLCGPIFELANEVVFYECMVKLKLPEEDEINYVFWFEIFCNVTRSFGYGVLLLISLSGFNLDVICLFVVGFSLVYIAFAYTLRRINDGFLRNG
jgi:hypothetical protein